MPLTAYHVLEEHSDGKAGKVYEPVEANVQAHSADHALRQTVKESGTYVAVPSRSFTPTVVEARTETVVQIK